MNKTAEMAVMAAVLVSAVVTISALGSTGNACTQPGKEMKADIVKNAASVKDGTEAFAPNPANVQPGIKVTSRGPIATRPFTVASGRGPSGRDSGKLFDSKIMAPMKEFSFKFYKKGTYDYFCMLYPTMA